MAYGNEPEEKDEADRPGFETSCEYLSPQAHGDSEEYLNTQEFIQANFRRQDRMQSDDPYGFSMDSTGDYRTMDQYMQSLGNGGRTWRSSKKD